MKDLEVVDATRNNLQHVDVTFEANRLTVITGVSGSGKSSLLHGTIAVEGADRTVGSPGTELEFAL